VTQDTAPATLESGEPQPSCGPIGSTVWYHAVALSDGIVTADTFGGNFDTALAVYSGDDLGALVEVGCNDDSVGLSSEVVFAASAGRPITFK